VSEHSWGQAVSDFVFFFVFYFRIIVQLYHLDLDYEPGEGMYIYFLPFQKRWLHY
jgi:hypothetical protein